MKKIYHTFLIGFALLLLLGASFLYFYNGFSSEAATTDSSLSSSASTNLATTSQASLNRISADTAFLTKLISLTKIKIDTTLFSNPSFQALHDNNVTLDSVTPGRVNPFAPIDDNLPQTNALLSSIVTNQPSQITDKTAVLNGAINSISAVTSSYFEYGPTPTLGKTTTPVAQSLVSTFVTKIAGLTTQTTYFYRAAAKIGGTIQYGEIISFNTN